MQSRQKKNQTPAVARRRRRNPAGHRRLVAVEAFLIGPNSEVASLLTYELVTPSWLDDGRRWIAGRSDTLSVLFPRIAPETVGQFLYLYESAISYMGGLLEINPYDQPAVELGKQATYALMGKGGYADLAKKIEVVRKRDKKYLV